jgi:hypothetical protein
MNDTQKAQEEGKRNRQRLIDALTDVLTGPEIDSMTLNEIRACWLWFPEGRELVEKIDRMYSEPRQTELRKAVLLSAIVAMLERLIA